MVRPHALHVSHMHDECFVCDERSVSRLYDDTYDRRECLFDRGTPFLCGVYYNTLMKTKRREQPTTLKTSALGLGVVLLSIGAFLVLLEIIVLVVRFVVG